MMNWLIFSSFVFSISMTLLGLLVDLTYQVQYAPKIRQIRDNQVAQLENYFKREEEYKASTVFGNQNREKKDLSLLIAQLQGGDLQKPLIEEKVKKSFYSMGPRWLDQKHKIPQIDTVEMLFANIEDYDHWVLPFEPEKDLATDLIVANQIFLAWSYFFQPLSLKEALQKSRTLSEILITTQDLNFQRAGLSILEKENEVLDALASKYRNTQLLWTPYSKKELQSFRNHLSATSNLLSPLTETKVFEEVFLKDKLPLSFCSLMKEKFNMLKWSQSFLRGTFPLEPNFSPAVANIEKVQHRAEGECENWQSPETPKVSWIRFIPYYRRLYSAKMILNAERKRKFL